MPSKYLFLSNANIASISGGNVVWNNLPTLSESTRECYVSILDMSVTFNSNVSITDGLIVKVNLPSVNYFSSDNDLPVLRYLVDKGDKVFANQLQESVELLTNDNIKKLELKILRGNGQPIVNPVVEEVTLNAISSINLTLKIDYVDQKAITQDYLSQIPMRL